MNGRTAGTNELRPAPARPAPAAPYDPQHFAPLFAIEDRHFWFRSRNRVIAAVARQLTADLNARYRVLEVGCGTGNVLRVLERVCARGTVMGMDLFAEGLTYARARTTCPLLQGDMHRPPFDAEFDLIGLFDVLEHLPDDIQVLRDLHAMLARGGRLLLTVPAGPSLWSYFDEASGHCRRYRTSELRARLAQAGFEVEYLTPYMAGIFPLVWLGRRFAAIMMRRSPRDAEATYQAANQELRVTPILNPVLGRLLAPEASLIARRLTLPFGASLLAVARKTIRAEV